MILFEPQDSPRVFAVPNGVDFPRALAQGLIERSTSQPPEGLARVDVILNTARMMRRCRSLFEEGPALLLPRMRLLTDLAREANLQGLPPPLPPLRRRLELSQLIAKLLMHSRILRRGHRSMIFRTVWPIWSMKCKARASAPK